MRISIVSPCLKEGSHRELIGVTQCTDFWRFRIGFSSETSTCVTKLIRHGFSRHQLEFQKFGCLQVCCTLRDAVVKLGVKIFIN